jgi:NADH dehydrogenase
MSKVVSLVGGSGFIGTQLARTLSPHVSKVRILARHPERAKQALADLPNISYIPIDTSTLLHAPNSSQSPVSAQAGVSVLERALEGSDAVVNLVGILYETSKQSFWDAHVRHTRALVTAANQASLKTFVQISAIGADLRSSSSSSSSSSGDKHASASDTSIYAKTKSEGESVVLHGSSARNIILRPSIVFGPQDAFLNRFEQMSRLLPIVPLIGGGHTKFQPIYVGDVAQCVLKAIGNTDIRGVYEIGGPQVYSFRQLMETMGRGAKRQLMMMPIPWFIAQLQGTLLQYLPTPLLTRDQVELLKYDNVVRPREGVQTIKELGVQPTALETVLPQYPWYRK